MEFFMHHNITDRQLEEILLLESECNARGRRFKLDPAGLAINAENEYYHTFCYDGEKLIGYAHAFSAGNVMEAGMLSLDGEAAVYQGMYALIKKIVDFNNFKLILLADRNDKPLVSFIQSTGAKHGCSEFRLSFDSARYIAADYSDIRFRAANPKDKIDLLECNAMDSANFGGGWRSDVSGVHLVYRGEMCIGKIKIDECAGRFGIYGVVLKLNWRGRGYGRKTMCMALDSIINRGYKDISLEVSSENDVALRLYESLGFYKQMTIDYYSF